MCDSLHLVDVVMKVETRIHGFLPIWLVLQIRANYVFRCCGLLEIAIFVLVLLNYDCCFRLCDLWFHFRFLYLKVGASVCNRNNNEFLNHKDGNCNFKTT